MRFNNNPFMSKALRKEIVQKSKLKSIYNNQRTEETGQITKNKETFA